MTLTMHEMKRLARNAAELMTLAGALQADGIQPDLLSGPLTGIYDPMPNIGPRFVIVISKKFAVALVR
ncbi:hypothetical protein [Actinomadura miaoliensis]|uniref:hypothetical protein n=1 Tax=Actinomadura miaoliensis TaxID=430685 RepID=UPI0031F15811